MYFKNKTNELINLNSSNTIYKGFILNDYNNWDGKTHMRMLILNSWNGANMVVISVDHTK